MKNIQKVVSAVKLKADLLYNDGDINETVTNIDIIANMLVMAHKNAIPFKKEIYEYAIEHEESCKYAKELPPEVILEIKQQML